MRHREFDIIIINETRLHTLRRIYSVSRYLRPRNGEFPSLFKKKKKQTGKKNEKKEKKRKNLVLHDLSRELRAKR